MRIVSTAFLLFFLITSPVRAAINGVAAVVNGEMITAFDLQAETAPEAMRRGLNPKDPHVYAGPEGDADVAQDVLSLAVRQAVGLADAGKLNHRISLPRA